MRWLALLMLLVPLPAAAQIRPIPGPGDQRLQTIIYHPDEVVRLTVAPDSQLTLILSADEHVKSVALGDSTAWQVTVGQSRDRLFIKPLKVSAALSNMTVITDAHVYTYDLEAADGPWAAYVIRYMYPGDRTGHRSPAPTVAPGPMAERYRIGGWKALRPASVADDGQRTYITFSASQPVPAVFALDAEGRESTVDGYMRDGIYTIDRIVPKLVFRIDRHTATAIRQPDRKPS